MERDRGRERTESEADGEGWTWVAKGSLMQAGLRYPGLWTTSNPLTTTTTTMTTTTDDHAENDDTRFYLALLCFLPTELRMLLFSFVAIRE